MNQKNLLSLITILITTLFGLLTGLASGLIKTYDSDAFSGLSAWLAAMAATSTLAFLLYQHVTNKNSKGLSEFVSLKTLMMVLILTAVFSFLLVLSTSSPSSAAPQPDVMQLGDWATWAGAISTFFTFVFLIVQNSKISARQEEADRLRDLVPYNESIAKYNQLTFLLNQHCTDKSNELTTAYELLCKIDGSPETEAILQYWHRNFRLQRHVTNNSAFQQLLQKAIWNIDIQELQSLFHFFSLTKKDVTSIMKIDLNLATYSQEVVLSEQFSKQSKSNEIDRKVVNECIGNFCRELHSNNYRKNINKEVDSLNALRQEFVHLTQLYNIEKDALNKNELQAVMKQLLCIPIIKLIHQYFQYFEMLTKEVALLEDAQFYLEKNYGKDEYTQSKNINGAHTVLLLNQSNLPLLEQLSSREVILWELYPRKSK